MNDFCGLLLPQRRPDQDGIGKPKHPQLGPWLCYAGCSGFGGYCSYGGQRFHRRARVWRLDADTGTLETWKSVEYAVNRVDRLVLVKCGAVVDPAETNMEAETEDP